MNWQKWRPRFFKEWKKRRLAEIRLERMFTHFHEKLLNSPELDHQLAGSHLTVVAGWPNKKQRFKMMGEVLAAYKMNEDSTIRLYAHMVKILEADLYNEILRRHECGEYGS